MSFIVTARNYSFFCVLRFTFVLVSRSTSTIEKIVLIFLCKLSRNFPAHSVVVAWFDYTISLTSSFKPNLSLETQSQLAVISFFVFFCTQRPSTSQPIFATFSPSLVDDVTHLKFCIVGFIWRAMNFIFECKFFFSFLFVSR